MDQKARTYGEVLCVAELLQLQHPLSPAGTHDELQYVTIHQCSELWFKLLLHELSAAGRELREGEPREAARLLRRCGKIVGLVDQGFALMESMTARDYAAFRPYLSGGSGFQSAQFRELEILLACAREGTLRQPAFTAEEQERIARRMAEPDLWDSFVSAMRRAGYAMPDRAAAAADPAVARQAEEMLLAAYAGPGHPDLREVSEEMAALDNTLQLWRFHHAAMAERAIGHKMGTGGEGVEYLYRSARIRCFPELMAVRTLL